MLGLKVSKLLRLELQLYFKLLKFDGRSFAGVFINRLARVECLQGALELFQKLGFFLLRFVERDFERFSLSEVGSTLQAGGE